MKNLRKLSREQKKFLVSQGLDSNEFLIERATADSYVFYHKSTMQKVEIRR